MRKGASGWLAKGMLILLVGSFAVWGIGGDMLGSSVGSDVIEAGSQKISLGEFQREYRNRLNQVSQYTGRQLTADQAKQFGIAQSTVMGIRNRLLEDQRTIDLALSVDDAAVLDEIRNGPAFKNEIGQFDRFRFEQALRQNGYSESEYIEVLRGEIIRRQLTESLRIPVSTAPSILVDTLFNHHLEKRSANYIEILDTDAGTAPTPTDDQLTKFIDENKARYTAPEYRKAKFLFLTPDSFTSDVTVTADELQQEYDGRSSEFNIAEKRAIHQMIFEDEKKAQDAAAKLVGGADFTAIASDMLQLTQADIDLGQVSRSDLLDALQEPVFSSPEGGITAPVKTILGWHLVKVVKIDEARTKKLDEVKDMLSKAIALRGATDILYKTATKLQDEFAGGATVEEAAAAVGKTAELLDWTDATGRGEDGKPAAKLPLQPEIVTQLFAANTGDDVDLVEATNGNYFAIELTDTQVSALKSIDKVRDQATKAWQANWQHDENKKKADALLEKLKGGATLASLGSSAKISAQGTRVGPIVGFSAAAITELFTLDKNGFALSNNEQNNGYVLFSLKDVVAADRVAEKEILDQLKTDLATSFQSDLTQQYQAYLQKKIGSSVKEGLIREYF
ncbi:MAG: SurA N-terminal domain-containing protein [Sneathiella sp.]